MKSSADAVLTKMDLFQIGRFFKEKQPRPL
jgi:hypothetical protein